LPEAAHGFIHFPVVMGGSVLAYSRQWISARLES